MKSKNGSFLTRLTALAGCLFLLAALAFGQSQANSGDIEGRVVDQNGAAIPNAALTAKNQATGIAKNTTADSGGNFRFVLLQPGSYTVTATANGFAQAELTNITVSIGGAANLEVRLSAGGANVTVDPFVVPSVARRAWGGLYFEASGRACSRAQDQPVQRMLRPMRSG